ADPDLGLPIDLSNARNPQPITPQDGDPTDPGPRNRMLEKQNPSLYIPPSTDSGDAPNAKWPLGLSHNRHGLDGSGYARQQNNEQLPVASAMAGVDMRLEPNAYRELHWHKANEWSLILNGRPGDVWFFPAGVPHSIQAIRRRRRVPAGLRRRLLQRRRNLPRLRALRAQPQVRPGQELPRRHLRLRQDPRRRTLHLQRHALPELNLRVQRHRPSRRHPPPGHIQLPPLAARALRSPRRQRQDPRPGHVPRRQQLRRRPLHRQARRHARAALAHHQRRVELHHQRPGPPDRLRRAPRRAGPRLPGRRRRLRA
ncbi:hypothetical protein EPUL_006317, partial [Erysiphe pulchra]